MELPHVGQIKCCWIELNYDDDGGGDGGGGDDDDDDDDDDVRSSACLYTTRNTKCFTRNSTV